MSTSTDQAVNAISRIATVGMVAGVSMKVLDNTTKLMRTTQHRKKTKKRRKR